jgi:thioredoxin-like negative regulator of GroEL
VTALQQHDAAPAPVAERPRLVLFYSPVSGRCRRAEGFLAQVLQRRHNHDTFALHRVSVDARSDLGERFRIESVPTILVIDKRKVVRRITSISNCRDLEKELAPWLR